MATIVVVSLPKRLRKPTKSFTYRESGLTYKLRKLESPSLSLDCNVPLIDLYNDLLRFEEQLDSDLKSSRKWIQSLLVQSPARLQGVLRVHIYNTHTLSQTEISWKLRIQGRLVHPCLPNLYKLGMNVEQKYTKKFNWFFRRIYIRLETGEVVEWRKEVYKKESDGIEIARKRYTPGDIQIHFYLDTSRFKLSPALSNFIGVAEETKENVLVTLWEYIKKSGLQDTEDPAYINSDETLIELFGQSRIQMHQLLPLISSHMSEPDPIVIIHKLRFDGDWTDSEHIYDFHVDIEDPFQYEVATYLGESRSVLFTHLSFADKAAALRIQPGVEPYSAVDAKTKDIDRKIKALLPAIRCHARRRDLATRFLNSPSTFVKDLIKEQNTFAAVLRKPGLEERMTEDREAADFYADSWVKDLVMRVLDLHNGQSST